MTEKVNVTFQKRGFNGPGDMYIYAKSVHLIIRVDLGIQSTSPTLYKSVCTRTMSAVAQSICLEELYIKCKSPEQVFRKSEYDISFNVNS